MRTWWMRLQPDWRKEHETQAEPWPLRRYGGASEDWDGLAKGGANGLMPFIVALGWWFNRIENEKSMRELSSLIEDVRWVLEEIDTGIKNGRVLEVLVRRGGVSKREREADSETGRREKKRYACENPIRDQWKTDR